MWIHDNIVEYAIDYSKCELCYLENIWRHQIYEAHTINVRLALYNLLPDSIILLISRLASPPKVVDAKFFL